MKLMLFTFSLFTMFSSTLLAKDLSEVLMQNPNTTAYKLLKLHYESSKDTIDVSNFPEVNKEDLGREAELRENFDCREVEDGDESKILDNVYVALYLTEFPAHEYRAPVYGNGPLLPPTKPGQEAKPARVEKKLNIFYGALKDFSSLSSGCTISTSDSGQSLVSECRSETVHGPVNKTTFRKNGDNITFYTDYFTVQYGTNEIIKRITSYGYCWKK